MVVFSRFKSRFRKWRLKLMDTFEGFLSGLMFQKQIQKMKIEIPNEFLRWNIISFSFKSRFRKWRLKYDFHFFLVEGRLLFQKQIQKMKIEIKTARYRRKTGRNLFQKQIQKMKIEIPLNLSPILIKPSIVSKADSENEDWNSYPTQQPSNSLLSFKSRFRKWRLKSIK